MKIKQSTFAARVAKFCVGGGLGVLAYYTILYLLTEVIGLWYVASSVIGFVANLSVNFIMQKFWTFNNAEIRSVHRQAGQYFAMGIVLLIANTVLLFLLVEFMFIPYLLAQLILTFALSIVSFFVTQRIFKHTPSTPPVTAK